LGNSQLSGGQGVGEGVGVRVLVGRGEGVRAGEGVGLGGTGVRELGSRGTGVVGAGELDAEETVWQAASHKPNNRIMPR